MSLIYYYNILFIHIFIYFLYYFRRVCHNNYMHLCIYATFTSNLGYHNSIECISIETSLCALRVLCWWGKVLLCNCVLHGCVIICRIDHSNLDRYFITYVRKSLMRATENRMVKALSYLKIISRKYEEYVGILRNFIVIEWNMRWISTRFYIFWKEMRYKTKWLELWIFIEKV